MANGTRRLITFAAGFAAGVATYALIRHVHDNQSTWDDAWELSSSPLSLGFEDVDRRKTTMKTATKDTADDETVPDKEYTTERRTKPGL